MNAQPGLIPVTIYVREDALEIVAQAAKRKGTKAPVLIAQLVERTAEKARRPPARAAAAMRSLPSLRTRDSLTDGDAVSMLSMLFLGASIEDISIRFNLAIHDVEDHLAYLRTTNRRSKRHPVDAFSAAAASGASRAAL